MWDTDSGDCEAEIEFDSAVLDITVSDFKMFAACTDGQVQMWDLVTGECIRDFTTPKKQSQWVDAITIACVNHTLYVASPTLVKTWDVSGDPNLTSLTLPIV